MKQMPLKETDDDDEDFFFAAIALGYWITFCDRIINLYSYLTKIIC